MEKRVAYITGGTKGIGFGIAKVLLENNFQVAITGRKQEEIALAVQELQKISPDCLGITADVRNFEDEKNAVAKVVAAFGKIDAVIANAGLGVFKPIEEMSLEEWNLMIDTNLTGCFHTLKASVEALKQTKGYYITISSLAGTNFFENGAGYNASKFGVVGFTQAAMIDLRKHQIKTSTIMPGSVATYFNGNVPSEKDTWKIQPEDLGNLVLDVLNMNPRVLLSKIEFRASQVKK